MKKRNYPNFIPETGNLTKIIRNDYINEHIASGKMSKDAFSNEKITGLIASNNTDDKLYFRQLYSILGEGPVHIMIKRFYENIFNDSDAPWFRDEFVEIGDVAQTNLGMLLKAGGVMTGVLGSSTGSTSAPSTSIDDKA